MILKHIIENIAISSFFIFLFSNFMWIQYKKENRTHRVYVGLIFGVLGIILMFFPIETDKNVPIPLDMRALAVVLPCILFGSFEVLIASLVVLIGMLIFKNTEVVNAILFLRFMFNVILSLMVSSIRFTKFIKIILILVVTTTAMGLYYAYLDNYILLPVGQTDTGRLFKLIASHFFVSTLTFASCKYVVRKTRRQSQLKMELKESNESLSKLVKLDGLTSVYNRRTFNKKIEETWNLSEDVALLMIDVDYFKQYNDTYGHLEGDECLKKVAKTISNSVRANDIVARYGGEEFSVILGYADEVEVSRVAERIRKRVYDMKIEHKGSHIRQVTVSIGASVKKPFKQNSYTELIKKADDNLYKAKQNGRNQVQF